MNFTKSKFAGTIGWTNDPATWPCVMNQDVRGDLIQLRQSTITTEFSPETSDRTVFITVQKSIANWWNCTSSVSRRPPFGPSFFTSPTSIIITWCTPKNFCTHHSVGSRKCASNRALQFLKPALPRLCIHNKTVSWVCIQFIKKTSQNQLSNN